MMILDNNKINEIVEEKIIPNTSYKKSTNSKTMESNYKKVIDFCELLNYNFSLENLDYVLKYLEQKNIFVYGNSKLYIDYNNYIYEEELKKTDLSDKYDPNLNEQLLKQYMNETDETKKKEICNALATNNIRLIKLISRIMTVEKGISYECFLGVGYEALIEAIKKYDSSQGDFIKFIGDEIKTKILYAIPEEFDFYNPELYLRLELAKKEVEEIEGRKIIDYKDDKILDLCLDNYKVITKKDFLNKYYYNFPKYYSDYENEENSISYYDMNLEKVEDDLYKERIKEDIKKALESLTEDEYKLIDELFGLSNNESVNSLQFAIANKVSRKEIEAKKHKVLEKLSNNKNLNNYKESFHK